MKSMPLMQLVCPGQDKVLSKSYPEGKVNILISYTSNIKFPCPSPSVWNWIINFIKYKLSNWSVSLLTICNLHFGYKVLSL